MKRLTKLTAFVMVLIMVLSLVPMSSFATGDTCPIIYLPGIAASKVYTDVTDDSTGVGYPEQEELIEAVKNEVIPALIVYAADKDVDKLAGVLSDEVNKLFGDLFNNPDGTVKENSGVIMEYPAPSAVKKDSRLTFEWDWREDPFIAAAKLRSFVEYVCESSGCDKVALASHSLGSVVILTYLNVYGDDKISGIVYDAPVIDGVNYIGEFFLGNFETDGEALIAAINGIFGSTEDGAFVESVLDVFRLAGIPEDLAILLNSVLDDIAPVIYRDTLVPMFARWLTIWAMTPADDVDAAMDYVFTNYLTDADSMVLKAKIEKYNSEIRADRYDTLLDFDKDGRFAVISRYGYSSLPLMKKWNETGDTVVETKSSSLGATVASFGECLDDEYIGNADSKYISPDETVDASTCLFPEKTWFIRNLKHDRSSITRELYSSLLFSQEESTCDNYKLSRFSAYDDETETITEDNGKPQENTKKSPFEVLFNFLKSFFEKILSFFKK